jgi:hypothetical protein
MIYAQEIKKRSKMALFKAFAGSALLDITQWTFAISFFSLVLLLAVFLFIGQTILGVVMNIQRFIRSRKVWEAIGLILFFALGLGLLRWVALYMPSW